MEVVRPDYLSALSPADELGTDGLVLYAMATVEFEEAETRDAKYVPKPGDNDPDYRAAAFAYGVSLAMEPVVSDYIEVEEGDVQDIFNRTFRLSFHYSAGSPILQSFFQLRIAQLLRTKYGGRVLREAAESALFDPSEFTIPANHKGGRALRRANERLPSIWEFYMSIVKNVEKPEDIRPLDKMHASEIDLLATFGGSVFVSLGIPYFMLNRELEYMRKGRPNKAVLQKKYRSDIREHAIEGKPIGNPEFNIIFTEMGIVLSAISKLKAEHIPDHYVMTTIRQRLDELKRLWEERHGIPFRVLKPDRSLDARF